jgi:hypothetical protein
MNSNKKAGRLVGILFLLIFATGIIVYQFLQGPVLFSDDFLTTTSANLIKVFSLAPALQGDSVAVPKPRLFIP